MTMLDQNFKSYQLLENKVGRKDRYIYAKAMRGSEVYFVKQALAKPEEENLRRELVWQDFMQQVESRYPELHIRTLRDVRIEQGDTLLTEWIDAQLLSMPGDATSWRRNLNHYNEVLVALDAVAEQYIIPEQLRTFGNRHARERLDFWLRSLERTPLINRAYDFFLKYSNTLESRMQHGDLTPWQIFATDDEWIIFDGERSGDDLPRFNDVAYSYGRLAARCGDKKSADEMLEAFITSRQLTLATIDSQLKPVLLFRLLGMLGDAAEDSNSDEYARIECLLRQCLESSLLAGQQPSSLPKQS